VTFDLLTAEDINENIEATWKYCIAGKKAYCLSIITKPELWNPWPYN
jgi:hypothetical protein